jgi:quinol monooxygenase YgiN
MKVPGVSGSSEANEIPHGGGCAPQFPRSISDRSTRRHTGYCVWSWTLTARWSSASIPTSACRIAALKKLIDRRNIMPNIQTNNQTVTQITVVDAEPEKQAEALSLMAERARFMARQPGFVSISLHRSLDGRRIVNYVQWQNRELLQQAHQSPDFRKAWGKFDDVTDQIDPHLYEVAEVFDGAR